MQAGVLSFSEEPVKNTLVDPKRELTDNDNCINMSMKKIAF